MKYIFGKRASGRSTALLKLRDKTGGIIITASVPSACEMKRKALEMGLKDITNYVYTINTLLANRQMPKISPDTHIYIDDFETIFRRLFDLSFKHTNLVYIDSNNITSALLINDITKMEDFSDE